MNALWHSPGTEVVTANMDAYFAFSFQAGSIRPWDGIIIIGKDPEPKLFSFQTGSIRLSDCMSEIESEQRDKIFSFQAGSIRLSDYWMDIISIEFVAPVFIPNWFD